MDQFNQGGLSPAARSAMYQSILKKRLAPEQDAEADASQQSADTISGVGAGIEKMLKGMYAGGAGAGDTGHWDRNRQIFKQRAEERQKKQDSKLNLLEKLNAGPDLSRKIQQAKLDKYERDADKPDLSGQLQQAKLDKYARDASRPDSKIQDHKFKRVNDLRKNYYAHPTTKSTDKMDSAYRKIASAANNPSAAGDLSLIFGYMKMLDPGSTVREGEFATAQNATGVPERVLNSYNRVMSGERLSETQRSDFSGQAKNVWDAQLESQKQVDERFKSFGGRYDVDFSEFGGKWQQQENAVAGGGPKPAPHGRIVEQDGVDYIWDGIEYKPKEADPASTTAQGKGEANGL